MPVSDGVDEDDVDGDVGADADDDAGVDADGGADAICTALDGDGAGPDGIRSERRSAPSEPML